VAALLSYGRSDPYFWRVYRASPHQAWVRDQVLPRVRAERSVAASYGFVPHLAVRRWVNQIPFFEDDQHRPVDCVLVDQAVNNTPLHDTEIAAIRTTLAEKKYVEDLRCGTFSLYRRPGGEACLEGPAPACPE
jgi:hypothetical protein